MEYYSAIKKDDILPFAATCVDVKDIRHSEISQRKTNTLCYPLYVEPKKIKYWTMHITKQKQTDRSRDQTSSYQKGEGREEGQDRCIGVRRMNCHI